MGNLRIESYTNIEEGGIWHFPTKADGSSYLAPIRLCDEFSVIGHGIDNAGTQYHVLSLAEDERCIIARGDVGTTDGWRTLRNLINIPSSRKKLDLITDYIQSFTDVPEWHITDTAGWYDNAYILPNGEIVGDAQYLYFNGRISFNKRVGYQEMGTVEEWRETIGKYAKGNSRLCLLLGAAFAAPLLDWLNIDGGIIHIFGDSSSGKTTAQRMAQSVWGHGAKTAEHWNATALATLNNAAARNDGLLSMDEISEDDSGQNVERSIYSLSNGKSRAQGSQEGGNRPEIRFKVMTISTGETSLEAHLQKYGRRAMAGQMVRCPSVPHTLENCHEFKDLREMTTHINEAVCCYYGAVGRKYIALLLKQKQIKEEIKQRYDWYLSHLNSRYSLSAQFGRTARLFAAAMVAIDYACQWGLLGFTVLPAIEGIEKCFSDWLQAQPGAMSYEEAGIIRQAREYLQSNEAFFRDTADVVSNTSPRFPGYMERIDLGTHDVNEYDYYVFPKIFKEEIVKNYDENRVKEVKLPNLP